MLDAGCWILDTGCGIQDAGCGMRDAGWEMPDGEFCLLLTRHHHRISDLRLCVPPERLVSNYVGKQQAQSRCGDEARPA